MIKIIKRNLLCLKNTKNLDEGTKLLYNPYKNIMNNLVLRATDKSSIDFDPVSRIFHGLESAPEELKHYYEALLGITSYYQASKGGRGKYIEKRFASVNATCILDFELSQLPIWLTLPKEFKKMKIYTQAELNKNEIKQLKQTGWIWKKTSGDIKSDLANIISIENEKRLVLLEIKNRTDSGGTAGRGEAWGQKFENLLKYLISNEKIFENNNNKFTLLEFLDKFKIKSLDMFLGILFNIGGKSATVEDDHKEGFYSTNKRDFGRIVQFISQNKDFFVIERLDDENLKMEFKIKTNNFKIRFGAIYGDEIPVILFGEKYPLTNLLILKYDDMWLGQLVAISERSFLLKYNKNHLTEIKRLLTKDILLKSKFDKLVSSEGSLETIKDILDYLTEKYGIDEIIKENLPEHYLSDVIQIFSTTLI